MSDIFNSLRLSWNIVIRNWTVYRKEFLANISPTLMDPALMMAALGMGLSPFIGKISGLSYAEYLAPGMVATTVLYTAFFECSYGFYVTMTFESVFKAMLTTPIGPREIVWGEFLWVYIRAGLMAAGVGIVLACMGLLPNPWSLLAFPIIGGFLSLPIGAMGLITCSFVKNINQFQTFYSFVISPMYFLSGIFFPVDDRPVLYAFAQISPFYHGVALMQHIGWGTLSLGKFGYHVGLLVAFTAVLVSIAQVRVRKMLIS